MKFKVRKAFKIALLLLLLLCSCTKTGSRTQEQAFFEYFDTVSYIYSYADDSKEEFLKKAEITAGVLEKYHKLLDIYNEYSGINNLCTINNNAGGDPVKVDVALIEFLDYAKEMYDLTDGKMNIAMGSVLSLWHDARTAEIHYVPNAIQLTEASGHIDFENIEINRQESTVRLTDSRALLDAGALGKGYAAEKAAEELEKEGTSSYVLNIGGNVRIIGKKQDNSGWKTGIKNPNKPDGPFALILELSDCSCVTSGSYERCFTLEGKRYHHIIDRDTLLPADYFESVTVICQSSALADALSTALFCMSREEGMALLKELDGVDCIWITSDGTITYTDGIKNFLINER